MFAVIALAVVGLSAAVAPAAPPATAADFSQFRPGNIISDEVFFNSGAMTEAQIQSFLVSKVPVCATGASCLMNTTQTTFSRPADAMCSAYAGAANEPVARIIYKVAQACGINPQVILVTLQKEQGLVTKSSPGLGSWQWAMGYAWPDTAPCDTEFAWFYNQVYKGTWQLKRYGNPPGTSNYFTWYPVGGYANVAYHPDTGRCGYGSVYIENKATAALYYYTPYQPNAAALAAGYGASSNTCSSYGNRNFYSYFTDWFGPTYAQGPARIAEKHAALGGATGPLGAPTSGYIDISANGGGVGQAFAGGSIYWSSPRGAWAVTGPFRDLYFTKNGSAGPWGWPASDRVSLAGGEAQAFQFASLFAKAGQQPRLVSGDIRTRYFRDGGAVGILGWPTTDESPLVGIAGTRQSFDGGVILSRPASTIALIGDIGTYYGTGSNATQLGWPASEPITIASGVAQVFANGSVYSSTAGTFTVAEPVRSYYFALGGSLGTLGWPTGEASCVSTTCSQAFHKGTAYVAGGVGRIGLPEIEAVAATKAAELGARTSTLLRIAVNGGGYGQVYATGSIFSSSAGAWAVYGPIRAYYFGIGGAAGSLGWPAGDTVCAAGVCSQPFQGGAIYWTAGAGAWIGIPAIETYAAAHTAALGARSSGVIRIAANGGGFGQAYVLGSVYSSSAGTWAVVSNIRSYYFALGGAAGTLQWPTADATCAAGVCSQPFQGGAIYWSSLTGARVALPAIEDYAVAHPEVGSRTSGLLTISGNGGGFGQAYSAASVYSSSAGTWAVSGGIRTKYFGLGGSSGSVGWPTADAVCSAGTCTQAFQRGSLSSS